MEGAVEVPTQSKIWIQNRRTPVNTLLADSRFAIRMLLKQPAFAAIAIATLALGIGANTAIFSVVDRVLLHRPFYKDPERLVMVWGINPQQGRDIDLVSPADFEDWRKLNTVFEISPLRATPATA